MLSKIRFASQFIMIDHLLKDDIKEALKQGMVDPQ